ncbi:MAG: glycosyltransferase [Pseudomonadota bacterium]
MSRARKISIITPVLNGADFIGELVDCLMQQSMSDWEHIVVDGGSSDSTVQVLQDLYRGDPRLVLLEEPGLALYPSVLRGFTAAQGHIIGWQNADDMYTPWAFQAVVDFQARTRSEWFTGLPGCWDEMGTLRFARPYGWYPRKLIKRGWFHADLLGFLQQESIFFSKQAFENLSAGDRGQVAEASIAGDFILWIKLAKIHKLDVLPTVLSGFRRHQSNLSHTEFEKYMDEVRMHGGVFLPSMFAALSRKLFRTISAHSALQRVESEDQLLTRELSLDREQPGVRSGDAVKPMLEP